VDGRSPEAAAAAFKRHADSSDAVPLRTGSTTPGTDWGRGWSPRQVSFSAAAAAATLVATSRIDESPVFCLLNRKSSFANESEYSVPNDRVC
jgi:hypothetical protein